MENLGIVDTGRLHVMAVERDRNQKFETDPSRKLVTGRNRKRGAKAKIESEVLLDVALHRELEKEARVEHAIVMGPG